MNINVITKNYVEPQICEKEILRYAGIRTSNESSLNLMHSCLKEAQPTLSYKVCFAEFPIKIHNNICDFGYFAVNSKNLAKNLEMCNSAVVFSATVGLAFDRLIAKYSKLSPSRAIMLQAIGAERVESLCDAFCKDIETEKKAKLQPRFSPGYGDLSLDVQKDIFSLLNCQKNIAVFLNESLLMSPSKSVTAFVGICK